MHLCQLPTELLLEIIEKLEPRDIANLSQTCRSLNTICRSDDVWKRICLELWYKYRTSPRDLPPSPKEGWANVWYSFLSNNVKLLGWWALGAPDKDLTSRRRITGNRDNELDPFTKGRLLRFSLASDYKEQNVYIELSNAHVVNSFDLTPIGFGGPPPIPPIPNRFNRFSQSTFEIPQQVGSPDSGLIVELLAHQLIPSPLLYITSKGKFIKSPAEYLQPSCTFKLDFVPRSVTSRASATNLPSFPNRACFDAKILRAPECFGHLAPQLVHSPQDDAKCSIIHPQIFCGPSLNNDAIKPPPPRAARSSARIIYQNPSPDLNWPDVPIHRIGNNNNDGNPNNEPLMDTSLPAWFGFLVADQGKLKVSSYPYFPIKGPTCLPQESGLFPETADKFDPRCLEGLWIGTYGVQHGLEFGYISVFPKGRQVSIQYLKLTGDVNVPRGQVSWRVTLDLVSGQEQGQDQLAEESDEDYWKKVHFPVVNSNDLVSYYENPVNVDWDSLFVSGEGTVAYPGFENPSTIGTKTLFISSKKSNNKRNGTTRDVVNEIRIAWRQLGHVSTFKRVTLD